MLLKIGFFLYFKGYKRTAGQAETTLTVLNVAAGDLPEVDFAVWLSQHVQRWALTSSFSRPALGIGGREIAPMRCTHQTSKGGSMRFF